MTSPSSPLAVGATAPDVTLKDQNGPAVSRSSVRRPKNVGVVLFPFGF